MDKILNELRTSFVHVLTGPRGCGKTELINAMSYVLKHSKTNFDIVFVTYGEEGNVISSTCLYTTIKDLAKDVLKNISGIGILITHVIEPTYGIIFKGFIEVSEFLARTLKLKKEKYDFHS